LASAVGAPAEIPERGAPQPHNKTPPIEVIASHRIGDILSGMSRLSAPIEYSMRGYLTLGRMNAVYLLSETGIALLFTLCLAFAAVAARHNRGRDLSLVLSAALFAALFENLNVLQIHGRGSYSYNAQFHLFIAQVPLFVVLSWAVILWTAMQISDAAPLRTRDKIVCDAVLAVLLDLAFDATAIRHGFWSWHGVGFNQAWFGVPAGNFFGWLYVALAFSLCSRTLDSLTQTGKLQANVRVFVQLFWVPLVAFAIYRGIETLNNAMLTLFGWRAALSSTDKLALIVFFVQFSALMLWSLRQRNVLPNRDLPNRNRKGAGLSEDKPAPLRSRLGEAAANGEAAASIEYSILNNSTDEVKLLFAHLCRVSFHVFAVAGLFALPAAAPFLVQQKPALGAVAGFFWVLDWFYTRLLAKVRR